MVPKFRVFHLIVCLAVIILTASFSSTGRKPLPKGNFKPKSFSGGKPFPNKSSPSTGKTRPSASKFTKDYSSPRQPVSKDDATEVVKLDEEERLQKIIARAGLASRRDAEQIILDGRVIVNGKLVKELGTKVHPRKDKITVDHRLVTLPDVKRIYWMVLNKPKDYLTTMEDDRKILSSSSSSDSTDGRRNSRKSSPEVDENGEQQLYSISKPRPTIYNLIPKANDLRLVPVGRLDRSSTGLLLLTNEVGWIHPLTHPSYSIKKRYEITVRSYPLEKDLEALRQGQYPLPKDMNSNGGYFPAIDFVIKDFDRNAEMTLFDVTVDDIAPAVIEMILECMLCPMVSMKRTDFGPLKLKGLKKGEWRELTSAEIERLKAAVRKNPTATTTDATAPTATSTMTATKSVKLNTNAISDDDEEGDDDHDEDKQRRTSSSSQAKPAKQSPANKIASMMAIKKYMLDKKLQENAKYGINQSTYNGNNNNNGGYRGRPGSSGSTSSGGGASRPRSYGPPRTSSYNSRDSSSTSSTGAAGMGRGGGGGDSRPFFSKYISKTLTNTGSRNSNSGGSFSTGRAGWDNNSNSNSNPNRMRSTTRPPQQRRQQQEEEEY